MAPQDDSTLPPTALTIESRALDALELPALVVLWSRHEPHRVGEVLLVPGGSSAPWIFGRGDASSGERRLLLVRQRPGATEGTGPIECPRISRAQIRFIEADDGGLVVENAGQCPMAVGGRDVDRAVLRPGEILELRNELLLLCTRRPALLPALPARPSHPFGGADDHGLIGESPAAWQLRGTVAAAAARSAHVLVLGASGSGKELVARAIHSGSARARRPLVTRNAATIPESLVDAELFGNIRNYPNPGVPERPGLIGQADGGTLFLDEIAELPPSLQAHLLRVLDDGDYQRLGDATARRADFRLVAATNRPEGSLKHDVLARLTIRITVPGLGERREDIPLLAAHLLRRQAAAAPAIAARFFSGPAAEAHPRLAPALVAALVQHRYTTHVRELDALLVAATLESAGRYVELTEGVRRRIEASSASAARPEPAGEASFTPEERRRIELQRAHRFRSTDCGRDPAYPGNRQTADLHLRLLVCKALQTSAWDVGEAAAILAGDGDNDLRGKARGRIDTFIDNLEHRLGEPPWDEARRRALVEEWRGSSDAIAPVLEALQNGWIRGRGVGDGDR